MFDRGKHLREMGLDLNATEIDAVLAAEARAREIHADPNFDRGPGGPLADALNAELQQCTKLMVDAGVTLDGPIPSSAYTNGLRRVDAHQHAILRGESSTALHIDPNIAMAEAELQRAAEVNAAAAAAHDAEGARNG